MARGDLTDVWSGTIWAKYVLNLPDQQILASMCIGICELTLNQTGRALSGRCSTHLLLFMMGDGVEMTDDDEVTNSRTNSVIRFAPERIGSLNFQGEQACRNVHLDMIPPGTKHKARPPYLTGSISDNGMEINGMADLRFGYRNMLPMAMAHVYRTQKGFGRIKSLVEIAGAAFIAEPLEQAAHFTLKRRINLPLSTYGTHPSGHGISRDFRP